MPNIGYLAHRHRQAHLTRRERNDEMTKLVWAFVSAWPRCSLRELQLHLGMTSYSVQASIRELDRQGSVRIPRHLGLKTAPSRARTVYTIYYDQEVWDYVREVAQVCPPYHQAYR